ncbi:MAG TPA: baseplate J/gp47 family protein [Candidatus Limnocylindrales bacterium]
MASRLIYLEVDDEITSAAARIRGSDQERLAVVLPYGSRVATSRINFRLLSRDATEHDKRLSIVSADPATRALAASAGLAAFASVAEYEAANADSADAGAGSAVGGATGAAVAGTSAAAAIRSEPAPPASDGTLGLIPGAAAAATVSDAGETVRAPIPPDVTRAPEPRPRTTPVTTTASDEGGRRIRTPWLIGGAILALALLVGGVGAYVLLPSATIVVTPRPEPITPLHLTVVADPTAVAPGGDPPVVPAERISIPVAVDDTFAATGKRVELTKATGAVRFENRDPTSTNRIPSGSIVSTAQGTRFRTLVTITVPRAELVGLTIFPARASVKITAVEGGPDGNVEPGTIVVVPKGESSLFLKVTNPEATSGGRSEEFTRVTQADVDGAIASLNASLQEEFRVAMADPAQAPAGMTVFPATGILGEATPTVPPETLVGQEVPTFALGLSATGTVVAADSAPVTAIAEAAVSGSIEDGHELVAGSVEVDVGSAIVIGQTVSFPVTVTADQIEILDPAELEAMVLGKPVDEAEVILEPYGEVEINVSPDWSGSVPSFESRVEVTIGQAVEIETPAPSSSAAP